MQRSLYIAGQKGISRSAYHVTTAQGRLYHGLKFIGKTATCNFSFLPCFQCISIPELATPVCKLLIKFYVTTRFSTSELNRHNSQ